MHTMNKTVIPFVSREDYPELLRAVDDQNSFLADYDSFLKLCDNMIKDYQKAGLTIIKVNINPGELVKWCRSQNRIIDSTARAEYAVFLYSKYSLASDTCGLKITANNFSEFTYSKQHHFACFGDNDVELYGEKKDPGLCDLKVYRDLLVYTFLKEHIPKGSRILDIGGGDSRIINTVKNDYECWNIDKLEGVENGPSSLNVAGFRLIRDYMGNFNKELPDNYFDFVFSISALEHTPGDDKTNSDIIKDINRVMKVDTFSLHCFDIVIGREEVWTNKLLPFIFNQVKTINPFIPFSIMEKDPSVYVMSEEAYNRTWKSITQVSYEKFGKPLSYNILWKQST
jgi:ubiquinone/menaquinone biosynthesis C-methylase UbiE